MLILVRVGLTDKGKKNKQKVIEELDYTFDHPEILDTEIMETVELDKE
tara:strand:- start:564 stop:707 length:144 start_codon:yes stop_codon:yes gene_type:complete